MKYLTKMSIIGSIAFFALGSGASYAGACLNVKQTFHNEGSTKIEVLKTLISGNHGVWIEQFPNFEVYTGDSGSAPRDHLEKLDSGRKPDFIKVFFKRWDPANDRWTNHVKVIGNPDRCWDGMTYNLQVNQNG